MNGEDIRSIVERMGLVVKNRLLVLVKAMTATVCMVAATAACADIPRTAEGLPDLTGTYDVATLTPVQRPVIYGDNLLLTKEAAQKIEADEKARRIEGQEASNPDREAPPEGGDGSAGAAGNVGGYNSFWIDRGENAFSIDGKFRTSIITNPKNGRRPKLTEAAQTRRLQRIAVFRPNTGDAWWLGRDGPGPYDDPEARPMGERCLLGFGSTAGPPMLPVLYNNVKRIVQTPTHVMILIEMNHDARIVRLNSEHAPADVKKWLGDSIGWWEGDTLVIDTTNFGHRPGTENLHVVERFTRTDENTLGYSFTVDDPSSYTSSWSGEYPWPATSDKVYEYACHEGNYALGNILRGARLLEADAQAAGASGE